MKRITLLISCLICLVTTIYANQDSLATVSKDLNLPDSTRAKAMYDLVRLYYPLGTKDTAVQIIEEALSIVDEDENAKLKSLLLMYHGSQKQSRGQFDEAMKNHMACLEISERLGDEPISASSFHNIARIYKEKDEFDEAIKYYQKSIDIKRRLNLYKGLVNSLNNLGNVKSKIGKPEEGLILFKEVLQLAREKKDTYNIAHTYGNIAFAFDEGFEDSSMYYYKKQLGYYKLLGKEMKTIICNLNIGSLFINKNELDSARIYILRGFDIAQRLKNPYQIKLSAMMAWQMHEAAGEFDKALEMLKLEKSINDSINKNLYSQSITSNQLKFSHEREMLLKESEAKAQEEALEKQKLFTYAGFIGAIMLALIAFIAIRSFMEKKKSHAIIEKEKDNSEKLLLNILPSEIAEELKVNGEVVAKNIDTVSVMFIDIVGFTQHARDMPAEELVAQIHKIFSAFDEVVKEFGLEKIKTIGDAYMCASGLNGQQHDAEATILAAQKMIDLSKLRIVNSSRFEIRVGIHTGPVAAGIVGVIKFAYDIWGNTVNIASRMESHSVPGRINVSGSTYSEAKNHFDFEPRGSIEVQNGGKWEMYFVGEAKQS